MIPKEQKEKFIKGCNRIKGKLRHRIATQGAKIITCKLDDNEIGIKEDWKDKLYVFVDSKDPNSTVSGHMFEAEQDDVIVRPEHNELEVEVGENHLFSLVNNRV